MKSNHSSTGSKIMHMCLDIRGYLTNYRPHQMAGMFRHDDGRPMSGDEAHAQLLEELSKGRRVLPVGACEGFDYQTGCPGHEEK